MIENEDIRYRVVWCTNGVNRYFYARDLQVCELIISTLVLREVDDDNTEFNCYQVECRYNDKDEWVTWEDEDGLSFNDLRIYSNLKELYYMSEGKDLDVDTEVVDEIQNK